jgi:hypothetical protein
MVRAKLYVVYLQALAIIDEMGDLLSLKYSRMPVPDISENDEEFKIR